MLDSMGIECDGNMLVTWTSTIGFSSICNAIAGTAGIWRIASINEAGGWKDRTTVEDMDLAVRASLRGWKFVYLGDLQVCPFAVSKM